MPTSSPEITADYVSLSFEDSERYAQVKALVAQIASEPAGLVYLLNAVALTGDEALTTMHIWSGIPIECNLDSRSFVGIIHERPLGYPQFVD